MKGTPELRKVTSASEATRTEVTTSVDPKKTSVFIGETATSMEEALAKNSEQKSRTHQKGKKAVVRTAESEEG
eukprot:COSAG01_NODE_412_length_17370_cov_26.910196_9_plen_73_part_00